MSRYPSDEVARFDQQFAETDGERNERQAAARKRRDGHSKLVYDKASRAIVTVDPHPPEGGCGSLCRDPTICSNDLLPCPFCGGKATRQDIDRDTMSAEPADENYGGSFIECDGCGACTAVHFDRKENLVSSWNDRHLAGVAEQSGAGAPDTSVRCGAPAARWRAFHAAAWPLIWGIETTDPAAIMTGLEIVIAPCMPEHAAKEIAAIFNQLERPAVESSATQRG